MRAQFRVKLAVGLAVVMAAAALSTPAQAATPSKHPVAASQRAPGIDGGPIAIPPIGGKAHKLSPYLPTLSVAGWTITPAVFLTMVRRGSSMDRAMMPIPFD